jgi:hypothetical protein
LCCAEPLSSTAEQFAQVVNSAISVLPISPAEVQFRVLWCRAIGIAHFLLLILILILSRDRLPEGNHPNDQRLFRFEPFAFDGCPGETSGGRFSVELKGILHALNHSRIHALRINYPPITKTRQHPIPSHPSPNLEDNGTRPQTRLCWIAYHLSITCERGEFIPSDFIVCACRTPFHASFPALALLTLSTISRDPAHPRPCRPASKTEPFDARNMQSYPSPNAVPADAQPFYASSSSQQQSGLRDPDDLQLTAQLSRGLAPMMNAGPSGSLGEGQEQRGQGQGDGNHPYEHTQDPHPHSSHIPPSHGAMDQMGNQYGQSESSMAPRKRSKVSRACDECRRKKIRCDATGEPGDEQCSSCKRVQARCQFSRVPMKRGPSKGYCTISTSKGALLTWLDISKNLLID